MVRPVGARGAPTVRMLARTIITGTNDSALTKKAIGPPPSAPAEPAREERQHEHRRELQRAHQAQAERRVRQLEHEPRLRHRLHPRADQRDKLAGPEEAEVTMTERAQGGGQLRVGGHADSLPVGGPRNGPPNPPALRSAGRSRAAPR